ncbi:MAG: hypothetical protein HGA33_00980 [Candidatus Moranbacteria bacterium]|nr:hypothetical protein [Candidatus Moranbacteria bacterium]
MSRKTILVNVGPLLREIINEFKEAHTVVIEEEFPRTVFSLPEFMETHIKNSKSRNLLLLRVEIEKIASNPENRGRDVFLYHSSASFRGEDLGHPPTREELRSIVRSVNGHVIQYLPFIEYTHIDEEGQVAESHFAALTPIDISVQRLSDSEIDEWLTKIPDEKIAESGPGGRPLAQGAFADLVESVECDQNLYMSLMRQLIRGWGIYR